MKIYRCIKNFQYKYEKYKKGDILVAPKGYTAGIVYRDFGHMTGRVNECFRYVSHLSKFELVFVLPSAFGVKASLSTSMRECISLLQKNNKLVSKTLLKEIAEVASA